MKDHINADAGEIMQYIVHPYNDNTIRFILHYPGRIDADLLRQAALALACSVDVLHSSFVPGRIHAGWTVNRITADDCFTLVTAEEPREEALRQALTPIRPKDPAQMRCILVKGRQSCALVLLISHLCADGSDSKYLLRKLCEAYNLLLESGSCGALTVKNGSRAVAQVYEQLSRQDRRQLLKDPRTGIKSAFPYPSLEAGEPIVLHRHISADQMAQAHGKLHALGATINDLLLTACYYAYADVAGADPRSAMSIMSMMDLRKHCEGGDSQGLCNLTGGLTTALPEGLGDTFEATLLDIASQTRRMKEDPFAGLYGMPLLHGAARRLPLGLLLAVIGRIYGSMAVGMTNIGSIDGHGLALGGMRPDQGWFGGPVKRKPGMQISAASFDGACALCIWGHAAKEDLPLLHGMLDGMLRYIGDFCPAGR